MRVLAMGLASILLLGTTPSSRSADHADIRHKLLELGSGPPGSGFRSIGEALCDAVNIDRKTTHVRCVTVGSAGSTYNLESVVSGRVLIGLSQENLIRQVRQDPRKPDAHALRVIAVTHESHITVVAGPQSGISDLRQLAGKRVNMGRRGSDQFSITQTLLTALDLTVEQLGEVSDLAPSDLEASLCGNQVDVLVEAVAHPSPLFQRLLACGGRFIDIPTDVAARMRADNRWLVPMRIDANSYDGLPVSVESLGLRNLLVTRSSTDDETVFRLAHTLRRHHAALLSEQPMLGSMPKPESIQPDSLPAPLHHGAARAYGLQASPKGTP